MVLETSLIRTREFRRVRFHDRDIPDVGFFHFPCQKGGEFVFVPEYVTECRRHRYSSWARGFKDYRAVFDDLEPLPVRTEIEPYKRKQLEALTVGAISNCLLAGELDHARQLLASGYFPTAVRTRPKGPIMKLCAGSPGKLGPRAYNFLYAMRHGRTYRPASI